MFTFSVGSSGGLDVQVDLKKPSKLLTKIKIGADSIANMKKALAGGAEASDAAGGGDGKDTEKEKKDADKAATTLGQVYPLGNNFVLVYLIPFFEMLKKIASR